MKKILIATDGANFSKGAFEFAKAINEQEPVLLTGVFLPQASFTTLWVATDVPDESIFAAGLEDFEEEIEKSVQFFERECINNGIEFRTHKYLSATGTAELKKETRFADLLIIGNERFYADEGTDNPNQLLAETLYGGGCPVILIPEDFCFPDTNILAYDGSESSVNAIKLFAYLFPSLAANKTLLVYVDDNGGDEIPDEAYIKELAARHFKDLTIMEMFFDPKKYFATWIADKKSSILVCGSYGRPSFSRIFNHSFIEGVIKQHNVPVFISHC